MIVAALIATVTFVASFTLPGSYVQSGSRNNEGMKVLSLPTKGRDEDNMLQMQPAEGREQTKTTAANESRNRNPKIRWQVQD